LMVRIHPSAPYSGPGRGRFFVPMDRAKKRSWFAFVPYSSVGHAAIAILPIKLHPKGYSFQAYSILRSNQDVEKMLLFVYTRDMAASSAYYRL
jgi:hypothetical protein